MKLLLLTTLIMLSSCSSIDKTFVQPKNEGQKIFSGTKNNLSWIQEAPRGELYPYTVMGLIDFIPSVAGDIILLPYTLYDKYYK